MPLLRQAQHIAFILQHTKLPYLADTHIEIADDVFCFLLVNKFVKAFPIQNAENLDMIVYENA